MVNRKITPSLSHYCTIASWWETAVSTPKNPTNAVDGILPIHSPSAASRRFSHHHAAPLE
ncbi:MAG: hypothetical protein GY943_23540 [Chloroflexi bacterium]|nr:hypothetical protein [Chloroflexota bacterium]